MLNRVVVMLGAVAAAGPTAQTLADFTPVSQFRYIMADARAQTFTTTIIWGPLITQSYTAPDYAPFVQTANASAFGGVGAHGRASTSQNSTIGPGEISATGSFDCTGHVGSVSTAAMGDSAYQMVVRFHVSDPTNARLVSAMTLQRVGPQSYVFSATCSTELISNAPGGDQTLASSQVDWAADHSASLDQTLSLAPGDYTLRLLGQGHVTTGAYNETDAELIHSFNVTLTEVAPPQCGSADFNRDGDTGTDADIEAFFACVAGSCCATCGSADFNGDGDTGTDADIEAFFRVLAGGTC